MKVIKWIEETLLPCLRRWVLIVYSIFITFICCWQYTRIKASPESNKSLDFHRTASAGAVASLSDATSSPVNTKKNHPLILPDSNLAFVQSAIANPREVWQLLRSGKHRNPTNQLWQYCAGALVALEGIGACEEVFTIEGAGSGAAKTAALLTLATNSPNDFVKFSNVHSPVLSVELASELSAQIAKTSPITAVNWALSLANKVPGKEALTKAFETWFSDRPEEASVWLNGNRRILNSDQLVSSVVYGSRENDPEASLAWANQLNDEEKRNVEIERSLVIYARKDAASAKKWLSESTLTADQKGRFNYLLDENALIQHGAMSIGNLGTKKMVTFESEDRN